jgi:FG-GAP-like repeat/FG-GAP repeat
MWIQNFFKSLTSTSTRRRPLRRSPPVSRLSLEALEDRCMPSFLGPVNYAAGTNPQAVVTGDFNGDGRLDLAVANYSDSTVSVLLGNALGGFGAKTDFATGINPRSLVVGDVSGDGKIDLVTANAGGDVSVLRGDGAGSFAPPVSIALPGQFPSGYGGIGPLPQSPHSVAIGDFNGDGRLDLAATGVTSYLVPHTGYYGGTYYYQVDNAYVNVLLSDGSGGLSPAVATPLSGLYPDSLVAGRFNADARDDLAIANTSSGTVSVLLSDGGGGFSSSADFYAGYNPSSVAAGDVNGDGHIDLVTANGSGNNVSVLLGDGIGGFGAAQNYAAGNYTAGVVLADFNHDSHLDIATANYYDNGVSVLLGRGNGTFSAALNVAAGSGPLAVAAGDFNGDGFPDLAVANAGSNNVSVLLNTGDWRSFAVSGFPSPTIAGVAHTLTVTALDNSGNPLTSYTGTVHFTSSDSQAVLPADYTFTAADGGTHTFTMTLKTAGTESITVTDKVVTGFSGTESGIIVNAAAASTMSVAGFPSPITAGAAGYVTVTLKDPFGNIASGYTGTVHFTSSDGKASLPANYTFTAADAGVHTFSATLKTAGAQSITAMDTTTGSLTSTDGGITVTPAAAWQFIISVPSTVTAGVAFNLTVTVEDAYGNVVTGYTGTIHFTSTDNRARLPSNYTFTASDKGVHTFSGLVLQKTGNDTITITDTLNNVLTDSVIVNVLAKKK